MGGNYAGKRERLFTCLSSAPDTSSDTLPVRWRDNSK